MKAHSSFDQTTKNARKVIKLIGMSRTRQLDKVKFLKIYEKPIKPINVRKQTTVVKFTRTN